MGHKSTTAKLIESLPDKPEKYAPTLHVKQIYLRSTTHCVRSR